MFLKEYERLRSLGEGAFGQVYKVRHAEFGYIRALKVSHKDIEDKEDTAWKTFFNECTMLLRIGNGAHPNIVRIYQPQLIDHKAVVEMDYVEGPTLCEYIERNRFIPFDEFKRFAEQIVGALAYCHYDIYRFMMDADADDLEVDPLNGRKFLISPEKEKELINKYQVIHNDLHSNNIIRRDYDGQYILLDFGLSIQNGHCVKSSSRGDGAIEYTAPEKLDQNLVSTQSDVYALGVLLYEMLTGTVPFPCDGSQSSKAKVYMAHLHQTPPDILELRKQAFEETHPGEIFENDLPKGLIEVIQRCLSKEPSKRYENAKELLKDLNDVLECTPPKGSSVPEAAIPQSTEDGAEEIIPEERPKGTKNRRTLFAVAVLCLIIILGAVSYFYFSKKNPKEIPLKEIVLPQQEYVFNEGDSLFIKPELVPADASDSILIWSSNAPDIVKVSENGRIEAIKPGSAVLTVSNSKGSIKSSIPVAVKSEPSTIQEDKVATPEAINPSDSPEIGDKGKQEKGKEKDNDSKVNPEPKGNKENDKSSSGKPQSIEIPSTIQRTLDLLVNNGLSREDRLSIIPQIMSKFFESDAIICTVTESNLTLREEAAEDFLRRIALTKRISHISIVESAKRNKIKELKVKEIRK